MKIALAALTALVIANTAMPAAMAADINTDPPRNGNVTLKSVGAGALSLIVWPGIGQAVNEQKGEKVLTHALVGLFPPFRFWSGYDALMDRNGGYWDGKI
ncbi:MAG: hypothetical protein VKJ06_08680 [Vampirovibrionales bacterium]|nr:hypothetical protein [Vampirovibrionales bacterium]